MATVYLRARFEAEDLRVRDQTLLRALVRDPRELTAEQFEAFTDMLERLGIGQQQVLTPNQRQWAEGVAEKLELDVGDPAERNAGVPRGREVEPAPVLRKLPKSPPGRR